MGKKAVRQEQMGSSHGIPFAYRIRGSDSERLCQALRDVVLRHEPLRTVLREDSEGSHEMRSLRLVERGQMPSGHSNTFLHRQSQASECEHGVLGR